MNSDGTLRALGKCLDINGGATANGTKIQLWTCHGGNPQQWAAQSDGTLRNPASAKCLDVSGNSSADGTVVHLWTCNERREPEVDLALTRPDVPSPSARAQEEMRRLLRPLLGAATAAVAVASPPCSTPALAADAAYDVLVFSKTAGFRHDAIPVGIQTIRDLGAANNFTVTATEDASQFTSTNLSRFEAVVFLNTTGDVLNASQQTAFEALHRRGRRLCRSALRLRHRVRLAVLRQPRRRLLRLPPGHPAGPGEGGGPGPRGHRAPGPDLDAHRRVVQLPHQPPLHRACAGHPRRDLVLRRVDGRRPPARLVQDLHGGRSFYTGAGHTQESYADSAFRNQLLGGIRYAAGRTKADCRPETGYTALYNGSTTGWSQSGPGGFSNADATLSSSGGMGMYWYNVKQFTNYSLKLDWRMTGDYNSGVVIGVPPSATDPDAALAAGYEVQIDASDAADRTTGAVYGVKSADIAARDAALNPPGEWNTYELLVEGTRLRVYLNGALINDFTSTDPARSLAGYIGIQNHGSPDVVSFRNIRIKDQGGTTPPATRTGPIRGLASKCLDVRNGSSADGTQIQLLSCSGSAAQQWTVNSDGTLRALGKCLDINGGSSANGAKVQLWSCHGGNPQQWAAQSDGSLRNPASGKCLDVSGNSSADGAVVHLWACHGGANQKWTLP